MEASLIVQAGGIAPASPNASADSRRYLAHTYVHAAVPGRTVVRLADESLTPALSAEMGVLGFAPVAEPAAVGEGKRRALGFPAWALVNHPKEARFALDVMKDFRKAQNRIKSKPGHARDAFVAIATELERKVPAFLPSFWEEAARGFLEHDGHAMAATCFEKARAAERTYRLKVDEDRRSEAYVEFTLAGAVSAKSLTSYAAELVAAFGAKEAEARYRDLNVRRIRGGLAPFAGLAKELRKLAKDAKCNESEADFAFLEAVLEAPSLAKAPGEFWAAYQAPLVALGNADPARKKKLLHLFPKAKGFKKFLPSWLALLEAIGAEAALQGAPPSEVATWLTALTSFVTYSEGWRNAPDAIPPAYFAYLKALAPVLGTTPVDLANHEAWPDDDREYRTDVIEFALECGIRATPLTGTSTFDMDVEVAKDPVCVVAHERWRPILKKSVSRALGNKRFEKQAAKKSAFSVVRKECLLELAGKLRGGLPTFTDKLATLRTRATAESFAEFPELGRTVAAASVAEAAHKTLVTGLFDEWTWPEWEATIADSRAPRNEIRTFGTATFPVLQLGKKLVVFHGKSPLRTYDVPAGVGNLDGALYLCGTPTVPMKGDLALRYTEKKTYDDRWLWMSQPTEVRDAKYWSEDYPQDFALADGRVTLGGSPLRVGDPAADFEMANNVLVEGGDFYQFAHENDDVVAFELDSRTLTKGRRGWPPFLRTLSESTDGLRIVGAKRAPAAPGSEQSPVGVADGVVGLVFRRPTQKDAPGGHYETLSVNGMRVKCTDSDCLPFRMPGSAEPRIATVDTSYSVTSDDTLRFLDESGEVLSECGTRNASAGFLRLPRQPWLHFLMPRDEAASATLRALEVGAVEALLAVARTEALKIEAPTEQSDDDDFDDDDFDDDEALEIPRAVGAWPKTLEAIRATLKIENPVIASAVALVLHQAAAVEQHRLTLLGAASDATSAPANAASIDTAPSLRSAIDAALGRVPFPFSDGYGGGSVLRMLPPTISALLEAPRPHADSAPAEQPNAGRQTLPAARPLPASAVKWESELASAPLAIAFLMTRAHHDPEARSAYRTYLGMLLGPCAPLFGATLHIATLVIKADSSLFKARPNKCDCYLVPAPSGAVAFVRIDDEPDSDDAGACTYVLSAAHGPFQMPADVTGTYQTVTVPDDRAYLQELLAAYDERGPVPFSPAAASAGEGTAFDAAASTLVFAGLPKMDGWENDFLGADLRAALGLKVRDASKAKEALRHYKGKPWFAALLADAARAPSAKDLWGAEGIAAFEAAVKKHVAGVPVVSASLVSLCKDVEVAGRLVETLAEFSNPASTWFDEKALVSDGPFPGVKQLDEGRFLDFVALLDVFVADLPVGDPARAALVPIYGKLLAFLQTPNLVMEFGDAYASGKKEFQALGGAELQSGDASTKDDGCILGVWDGDSLSRAIRTTAILTDWERVAPHVAVGSRDDYEGRGVRAAHFLMQPETRALVERMQNTPVPMGQFEANPLRSVPTLVAKVAAAEGVSTEAAALYLQLLALWSPTSKAVCAFNGWKSAQYTQIASELAEKGLVLEAKRDGAGRNHFLPGGWDANRRIEHWKVAHGHRHEVPIAAPHIRFEQAYARVESGDRPGFEKAERTKLLGERPSTYKKK